MNSPGLWNIGLYAFYVMFSLMVLVQIVVFFGAVYLLFCLVKYILPTKKEGDAFIGDS